MSNRAAYVRRIRHWIANRGVRGLFKEIGHRLLLFVQGKSVARQSDRDTGPHPFDRAHGVDTTGLLWGESLGEAASKESQYWATGYYGIAPSAFDAALDNMALDWPRFTFVDIGCGKGRALLLALRHPFRRVLGVELSPELVSVAKSNLERFTAPWRQPEIPAEAIAADATSFSVPDGPLLLYLYHPFAGPMMKRFVGHLKAASQTQPREILLLYGNPELGQQLEASGDVEQLWRRAFALTDEDRAADRFGSSHEYFAAYRLKQKAQPAPGIEHEH